MFFPQRMKKLDVVIIKKYADEVSKAILGFGNFEVMRVNTSQIQTYALKRESLEEITARFLEARRRLNAVKAFFGKIESLPSIAKSEYMDEMTINNTLKQIENDITAYNHELESLKKRQNDLQIKLNSVRFFGNLDIDLSQTRDVKHIYMGFGSLPSNNYQGFIDAISSIPSVVMNVGTVAQNNMIFFTVPNSYREKLNKILQNVYFKDYGIPQDVKGNIKSSLVRLGLEYSMTHDEEIWLEDKYRKMVKRYSEIISKLEQSIDYHISMTQLRGEMLATNSVYLFSGWVPADDIEDLKSRIEKVTEYKCVFLDEDGAKVFAREGILPPTLLKNPKPLKPFELLVFMFGTPNYRELDPTPFAALTYVIMFGAMFGDVGHGLILSLLGLLLVLLKLSEGIRNIAAIMFWVGLSSVLFGILYGEMFGRQLFPPLWVSPIHNIDTILTAAVFFGAGTLIFGILLGIVNSILHKNYGQMLFAPNGIAGLVFYISLLYMGYQLMTGNGLPPYILIVPILAGVFIWLEKWLSYKLFRHGEKESPALGLIDLFETSLSMLSNTISFVRVGAFALNHGALMSAVFVLASMAGNSLAKALIILIGNIFVIGFEGLVVGIQSLRLEYYEFFIKFFRADGRQFSALDGYKKN